MFVAWLVCLLRGASFIVDWHNLGFSILAMRFPYRGESHPVVRLARLSVALALMREVDQARGASWPEWSFTRGARFPRPFVAAVATKS